MDALVSIIIPVYNLQDYIENCLRSVMRQSYKNIEIICVDDGSSDKSADKINSLAADDDRIVYIFQKNAGVSVARNTGLENAKGDCVMFVDGDDYIHHRAVEILLNCMKSGYDMVCTAAVVTELLNQEDEVFDEYTCAPISYKELFSRANANSLGKSSCGKIIKRDVAMRVRFPAGMKLCEDGYYIIKLLNTGVRVGIVDKLLYRYYHRPGSCCNSEFSFEKSASIDVFDMLCESFKESGDAFLRSYCLQYLFQAICTNRTLAIGSDCEKQVIAKCKMVGEKWMKTFAADKDINIFIRAAFVLFFYSRPIYELVRAIQDPSMFDFYKNRKKS